MQEENDIMALKITIKKINYECKGGFCNVYEKNWNDTFSLYANTCLLYTSKQFEVLFQTPSFFEVLRNTVVISALRILFGFPAPILLALLLNELRSEKYKRVIQTISYLPHFLSWVVDVYKRQTSSSSKTCN